MIINTEVVELFHYISSQNEEQKVSTYQGQMTCRYGYGRAKKTALQGGSAQDFLSVHIKGDRCNFVICDGVGESNQGSSTTRYLGNTLLDWLDSTIDWSSKEFLSYMEYLPVVAMKELQNPISSDTMYICGRLELPTLENPIGRIWMAWQGDSRLRFWRNGVEVSQFFKGTMRAEERWSISEGPLGGEPHVYQSRLEYGMPMRLQLHTDGLRDLDPIDERLPDEQIQILFDAPHTDGLIEDAAFLEFEW